MKQISVTHVLQTILNTKLWQLLSVGELNDLGKAWGVIKMHLVITASVDHIHQHIHLFRKKPIDVPEFASVHNK